MKNEEQTSTILKNKLSRFHIDLNGEIAQKGDNLWGLFSGVTKYTTHSLTKDDKCMNFSTEVKVSEGWLNFKKE